MRRGKEKEGGKKFQLREKVRGEEGERVFGTITDRETRIRLENTGERPKRENHMIIGGVWCLSV